MTATEKVFGDIVLPGVEKYALTGLNAACSMLDPKTAEKSWGEVRTRAAYPRIAGKRLWFRSRYESGDEYYISLTPGEFRVERPSGLDDVIVDCPSPDPGDTLAKRLGALLNYVREDIFDRSQLDRLELILRRFEVADSGTLDGAEMFLEAANRLRTGDGDRQTIYASLYHNGLIEHRMPLIEFSSAMALLQLQNLLGQWIDPGWLLSAFNKGKANLYREPVRRLWDYVHTMASSDHRQRLMSALAEMGNCCYRDASASVKSGLRSFSMITHTQALVAGAHQYWIALIAARAAEREKLPVSLQYKLLQAEEGYACTQTGILSAITFLFESPSSTAQAISEELDTGDSEATLEQRMCSPFWPSFTRKFTRVLIAHANSISTGDRFQRGLSELVSLEQDFPSAPVEDDVDFERAWIDHALLNAYRQTGDSERVKQYATRIAGQMIVRRILGQA